MEVTIPPEWMDRTIGEINIRKKYNINILALKKDGKLDMNITPDTQLCRDESMLVLGKYASIQKCFRWQLCPERAIISFDAIVAPN